jgi:hypothetical protein
MNMKIASIKFLAVILFSAIAIAPLRAQTNAPAENGTNQPVAVGDNAQTTNPVAATGTDHKKNASAGVKMPGLVGIHMSGTTDPEDIVSVVVFFGALVMIFAMSFYFHHHRDKMKHETLRAMIEKGIPITPELLAGLTGRRRCRGSALFPALLMIGIGTAMLMTNYSGGDALDLPGMGWAGARGGWIVLFMGVAFLIVWLVERKNKSGDQPPKP